MSTVLGTVTGPATAQGVPRQAPELPPTSDGPSLHVVPRPVGMRRTPSLVAMVLLVAAGLVGLLMLNTAMQRRAFELTELDARADALDVRVSALTLRTDRLESTARLAERASRLGMVHNPSPVFLHLSDRSVIGDPTPAVAGSTVPGLRRAAPPAITEPQRSAGDAPSQDLPAGATAGEDEVTGPVPDDVRSPAAGGAVGGEGDR
ncbi:MAG TPA: hypothetical protein VEY14_10475 [Nocardioidaceae bacterium]|nr:hypothetical protein [Nocardioidaceae bacterium]